jgi:hypothetical protein
LLRNDFGKTGGRVLGELSSLFFWNGFIVRDFTAHLGAGRAKVSTIGGLGRVALLTTEALSPSRPQQK